MDTLTHALSGALLARATNPARPRPGQLSTRARMATGFAAAAFPDVDFLLRGVGTLEYLNWHQGITHSILFLPVWALLLALLFAGLSRGRYRWQAFFGVACLGIGIHVAGDVITAYGPALLAPFSGQRLSLPFAFAIDPVFSAIIIAGLLAAISLRNGRQAARLALVVLAAYVVFLGLLQQRAIAIGAAVAAQAQASDVEIHALPQPFSPFHWMIIVQRDEANDVARVNLRRGAEVTEPGDWLLQRMVAAYRPVADADWRRYWRYGGTADEVVFAHTAWLQEDFAGFREFARFPVLDSVTRQEGRVCAQFFDLRFLLPELPPSFRFAMCRDEETGEWQRQRVRGAFWID